ncbi:helix-turn-helix domain-containing protein [Aliiglaciecola sp. NS0011-25]|uniref:helix-turn-helix domain-containing protein n=1 Tax=Aliiglaciecola sp. NS0011-25 TaxID=3127654 RepID=UPI003104B465
MSEQIPFYDLYGESFVKSEPGLVHLEDVAYRSDGLGWEIEPHRHNRLAQVICTFNDSWTVYLDEKTFHLKGNWLVLIPTGVVHGFKFEPDTKGYVLSISKDFLVDKRGADSTSKLTSLIWTPQVIEFRDQQQIQRFIDYMQLLKVELKSTEPDKETAVNNILQLVLLTVGRQQHLQALNNSPVGRESKILLAFRNLIENQYQQHLSVSDYAKQLHISVSTLNRLCQSQLRESPKAIIHQRLVSEAKRRLIYTRQSVEDISYTLGFKDPGYFSRFFKQCVGKSASEFRKNSAIS